MTDNSDIVLRWVIDDAVATLATGRAESGVFHEGGFMWSISMQRLANNKEGKFTLKCGVDDDESFKCEVEIEGYLLKTNGNIKLKDSSVHPLRFDEKNTSLLLRYRIIWDAITYSSYLFDGKLIFEFRIHIISSERCQPRFNAPNDMSNVILKIGEKNLHVSKEYLAVHSPVFNAMFFGNFVENGKEEVEIKDVIYEEFLTLLHVIYPGSTNITDRSVLYIMKLADQFQMKDLMDQAGKHLTSSEGFDSVKKLLIADQYRLIKLKNNCLQSFTSSQELIQKIQASPECADLSAETRLAIYDRLMKM